MTKAVAKTETKELTTYEDAGAGFEGISSDDMAIPFLKVAQALSDEVQDGEAKAGDLINTVTGEVVSGKTGVGFQPCYVETVFVEWRPRASGGGMVARHASDSAIVQEAIAANDGSKFGGLKHGDHDLIETAYVYGLTLDEDGTSTGFAILSFSGTKMKVFRKWITVMRTLRGRPPIYANRVIVKTVEQSNPKGRFYNYEIKPFGETFLTSLASEYTEAKEFRAMIEGGAARAAEASETSTDGDEIPF